MNLELFVIRNKEGKFFRRKGYGGYGDTWVDTVEKARIYTKIGGARTVVGFFANNYPTYGAPDIIKLTCTQTEIIDETERIKKNKEKRQKAKARAEAVAANRRFAEAEKELENARLRYEKLQGKRN